MKVIRNLLDMKRKPILEWTIGEKQTFDDGIRELRELGQSEYRWSVSIKIQESGQSFWDAKPVTDKQLYFIRKILPMLILERAEEEIQEYLKMHKLHDEVNFNWEEEEWCPSVDVLSDFL